MKQFLLNIRYGKFFLKRNESCKKIVCSVLNRCRSQCSKVDIVGENVPRDPNKFSQLPIDLKVVSKSSLCSNNKSKLELTWLTKALEPALQLCRWALPTGLEDKSPRTRSISEIIASIQRSKIGIEGWTISDLTVGLYLIYLRQASTNPFEDIKGVPIFSDSIVQDLLYHTELAKGAYKNNVASLAKNSMLRANNIVKHVTKSNVMRPGYYIGVDTRKKIVILGIRGTHTIYDLITNIVISSGGKVTYDGYSTHFGTAEAARWFLNNEMETIKSILDKHEGFRLRLVGHSLGGAIASLLTIMLRKKSFNELGFSPEIVSAVGYASPPCISKELAENCAEYVTTVVMQDDIIPRLSQASLMRLRNEILKTDWMSVLEKEDCNNVLGLITNAKQVMFSAQDVARKLVEFAKFKTQPSSTGVSEKNGLSHVRTIPSITSTSASEIYCVADTCEEPEELFVPGTVYYLKRNVEENCQGTDYFSLWKRQPGEHFQRIILSNNLFSDHKCDSHYSALRDVLKGLPASENEFIFR